MMPSWLQPGAVSAPAEAHAAQSPSGPYRAYKQFGLVVLCALWVLLGLFGHDPWKTEDAVSFGVVWDMLHSHAWLTPTLVGEPFVERPPLVYALGALCATVFGSVLAPHDAARIAVALLLGSTLFLLALTARELVGRGLRWVPVLLFIGCVGLWDRSHQLAPELGTLAALALALYGLALGLRRAWLGGFVVGAAIALAFLSYGWLGPLWIGATLAILPLLFRQWRTPAYGRVLLAAVATGAVGVAAWPLALASVAPDHLHAWWKNQTLATYFAPLAPSGFVDPWFVVKNLPWFTWPAAPLALWTLWTRGRGFNGGMASAAVQVPAAMCLAIVIGLTLMPEPRSVHLMLLIVPMSLLGAIEVDTLKRGLSGALDWFGILTFGLVGALVWGIWWESYFSGMPPGVALALRDTSAGYRPGLHGAAMALCVLLTGGWLLLVRPARRSNRRAILNWTAGTMLVWALFSTIWLPYVDSRRSYRSLAEAAAPYLRGPGCIATRNVGDPQRALLYYFTGTETQHDENAAARCSTLLVQYPGAARDVALQGWSIAWEGTRRGDNTERYVLYRRDRG